MTTIYTTKIFRHVRYGILAGASLFIILTPSAAQTTTSLAGTQYQIGGSGYGETFLKEIYVSVLVTHYTAFTHSEFEVSKGLTQFSELSYSRSVGMSNGPQPRDQGTITVKRDSAYLPAATASAMDAAGVTTIPLGRLSTDLSFPEARSVTPAWRVVGALFIHGDNDHIAPIESMRAIADGFRNAGVPTRFMSVGGGGHSDSWLTKLPDIFAYFEQQDCRHSAHSKH